MVKNLTLLHLGRRCATHDLVELPNEPITDPVYLDFLYIDRPFVFVDLLFAPTSRFSLSRLRSLCVRSSAVREHAIIWQLLQSCLGTLEDFEFNPTHEVASPALIPFEELIDLGKIVSLQTFTASLTDYDETNYAPWFNRIISSASGNLQLEEICLNMIYVGDRMNQTWWRGAFDALLQGEFKSLKRLKIFLKVPPVESTMSVASVYGNLYDHEGLQQLRSQRGVAVEIYHEESD